MGSFDSRRAVGLAALAVVALTGLALAAYAWWPVPQMGSDDEVFKAVDALFTAVTSRDEGRLSRCEARLSAFAEEGRLPSAAARRLGGVIAQARAGGWEAAARSLYNFMQAQRREGPPRRAEK